MGELSYAKGVSKLNRAYLFSEVRARTNEFLSKNGGEIINLGIGDVAYPLPKIALSALRNAVEEMGDNLRFKGYPKENGYDFLKRSAKDFYFRHGVKIEEDEVFVGEGAKSDLGGFPDIIKAREALIPSPVYPAYVDCAVMKGMKITYAVGDKSNGFLPMPSDDSRPKLIWLCSPNNPTGACYNHSQLKEWVEYALKTGSLILFDGAYSAFANSGMPRSIFEIDGARECAVEFFSFSKYAGFTNLRCSFVVIPKQLKIKNKSVLSLWARRQSAKFNGVCYPVQRAGEAVLSEKGEKECALIIEKYRAVSRDIRGFFKSKGVWCTGDNSPYVWLECPRGLTSWELFDKLLSARIVGSPGVGFGKAGEGYFRLSCFCNPFDCKQAVVRLEESKIFG